MTWFVLYEKEVLGPFKKEYILNSFNDEALIWGPGLDEWSNKNSWKALLNKPKKVKTQNLFILPKSVKTPTKEKIADKTQPKAKKPHQLSVTKIQEDQVKWYYACNKEKFGPFTEPELIQVLQILNFSSQIYIWKKSLDNWKKLEDVPQIISQITKAVA